ncbi:YhcN/YlaJ family sporulation lipoprotein [Salipaludibacillus sp. CUR1]|uniref:YhcN/YlaJ family sporulation lipoprotein n=1 Tax=Salipaludibacillus sp. CUR1 TaxID=2820003 RepID=UPI001E2FF627|nr:YhcN/YlaJ family sporulation lipoprotein [Salipaludibacillus sp. CUR1]MCE7791070.1 YhcN/YlaJ family sporulation lipoprotein [Salipaludibacillus sp. CUR1]
MRKWAFILSLLIILSTTACQTNEDRENLQGQSVIKHTIISQVDAETAEKAAERVEKVDKAQAVSFEKDIFIYLDVEGFDRFFLKDIRSQTKKEVEDAVKGSKVQVSTDKKIEMEITELKERLNDRQISKKKLEEEIKKIEEDMKA